MSRLAQSALTQAGGISRFAATFTGKPGTR
jgi:hypothetical protein